MQNNITDKQNAKLSNEVYGVASDELKVENNKNNGMQAMAVAPVDSNGNVENL